MSDRRDALKIIGAIGTTCAFPFSADELYGQHAHGTAPEAQLPKPSFFTPDELAKITKIADLIIPRTDTPGAVDAQVPAYIDYVCSRNQTLAKTVREGLKSTVATIDVALLTKLDAEHSPFFTAMKNLTADGFYTSRIGLVEELGYKGNSVLAAFPVCEIPEH
jgi:hypothetical protein